MEAKLSQVSKPVKIGAAVGLGLIVVVLGYTMLKPHTKPTTAVTAAPVLAAAPKTAKGAVPKLQLAPGLPPALRLALRAHGIVVAVLSGAGDGDSVSTAREGAKAAHAGFAVLNIGDESVARDVATLVPSLGASTVLVFRRPGTVAMALPSYSDSDTVAQAAADSRSEPTVETGP